MTKPAPAAAAAISSVSSMVRRTLRLPTSPRPRPRSISNTAVTARDTTRARVKVKTPLQRGQQASTLRSPQPDCPARLLLASGSWDGTINLWDPGRGHNLETLMGHSSPVYGVALSADGQVV